ncbi:MAG TPA: CHAD domain-containing protein [Desulfobulbaceae bacterium]|nr:CHAD domain-containing protein [Desulfobulbaceae bacterium]
MQPLQQLAWTLPENLVLSDLQVSLANTFDLKSGPVKKNIRRWYDTFDWRLFRADRLLKREGSNWILQDFDGNDLHTLKSGQKIFHFSRQFPESPLRTALEKILDVRALIELGRADVRSMQLGILNRDSKIVAQLEMEEVTRRRQGHRLVAVRVQEIRGYAKWFEKVAACIRAFGAEVRADSTDILRFILQESGREPLDYSSGYDVPLDPGMKSIEAIALIYRFLLNNIQCNEQGVIDDIDTEFLHDLRVAVRRTRSGLSLIKDVLDAEVSRRYKKEFKYIGGITGPVRDLDVYLLSRGSYTARLPKRLRRGMDYFFEDIKTRRWQEQRKLVHLLEGKRYQQILTDWAKMLDDESGLPPGENSDVPIAILAGKIIHKRFRRVLRDGTKIHKNTPDRDLHCLRIECKKLRYSLEFFSSLYNQEQMKQLIKQLKMLQNNLGDFNDLSVQQQMLADYLTQIRPRTVKSRELAASIGGLMTDLNRQHSEVRAHFESTFAHFSRRKNLDLYHKIFNR